MQTVLQESLELRSRYDEEPSHSDHVALLALQLFDGLKEWHKLGPRAKELLHSAAILHDIGWSQTPDGKGHHKWSAKLIRQHDWDKLNSDEVELVAQIARYHRKAPPEPDHEEFHELKATAKKTVMILGGILRIADALDRTHTGRVTRAGASVTKDAITVRVETSGLWEAERAMFTNKRDMLQFAAERQVLCISQGE
jgi:exopolyphosphatase/guanosine-5'-triphosphate,3'-diphosphate pyrophosphatase